MKVGKLDIIYLTGGQGEPLVVIHGGCNSSRAWLQNAIELSEHYTVYIPDLPGFGRSQPMDGNYYIPELVEFVNEFSHNLGLRSFYLIGHSLGGGIALSYVLKTDVWHLWILVGNNLRRLLFNKFIERDLIHPQPPLPRYPTSHGSCGRRRRWRRDRGCSSSGIGV